MVPSLPLSSCPSRTPTRTTGPARLRAVLGVLLGSCRERLKFPLLLSSGPDAATPSNKGCARDPAQTRFVPGVLYRHRSGRPRRGDRGPVAARLRPAAPRACGPDAEIYAFRRLTIPSRLSMLRRWASCCAGCRRAAARLARRLRNSAAGCRSVGHRQDWLDINRHSGRRPDMNARRNGYVRKCVFFSSFFVCFSSLDIKQALNARART